MLKIITLFAAVLMFSAPAFAGSCPTKVAAIDAALAEGNVKNPDQIKKMRDKGQALHDAGKHAQSVQVLSQALKMAGK